MANSPEIIAELITHARNNPSESNASMARRFKMTTGLARYHITTAKKKLGDAFYLVKPRSATNYDRVLKVLKKMRNKRVALADIKEQTELDIDSIKLSINLLQNQGALIRHSTMDDGKDGYIYKGTQQIKQHNFQDAFRLMSV